MTNSAGSQSPYLERALDLHHRILTFDGHIDLPTDFGGHAMPANVDGPGRFDLVKTKRGLLKSAALVLHAPAARPSQDAVSAGQSALDHGYDQVMRLVADHPEAVGIARSPQELRGIVADGRFAAVLALQNAAPFGIDVSRLVQWAERGVSLLAFNFIGNNSWADSARPYPFINSSLTSGGLSAIGKAGVEVLNDLGVMIDVSQMSSAAFSDVLTLSRSPIVASHSAVRGLVDVDRNFSDEELKAIKRNGGVINVVGFGMYVRPLEPDLRRRLGDLWTEYGLARPTKDADLYSVNDPATAQWDDETFWRFLHEFHVELDLDRPAATVHDLVDAIDYAVARAGIDHVGIASDFNHGGGLADWRDVGETPWVTACLMARGYSDVEIEKLWGGNFMRVWEAVRAKASSRLRQAGGDDRSQAR